MPPKREKDRKEKLKFENQTSQSNRIGAFGYNQDSGKIDQRLIMEILRIIQQRYYRSSTQDADKPLLYILSTRAGKAHFYSCSTSYERLDSIYSDLAPRIYIRTHLNRKGLSLPVVDYRYENYDPEKYPLNRVNFKRMVVDPDTPFMTLLLKKHWERLLIFRFPSVIIILMFPVEWVRGVFRISVFFLIPQGLCGMEGITPVFPGGKEVAIITPF